MNGIIRSLLPNNVTRYVFLYCDPTTSFHYDQCQTLKRSTCLIRVTKMTPPNRAARRIGGKDDEQPWLVSTAARGNLEYLPMFLGCKDSNKNDLLNTV